MHHTHFDPDTLQNTDIIMSPLLKIDQLLPGVYRVKWIFSNSMETRSSWPEFKAICCFDITKWSGPAVTHSVNKLILNIYFQLFILSVLLNHP